MNSDIRFSYNWNNKLAGKAFTTMRLRNDSRFRTGDLYEIWLRMGKQDKLLCYATIIDIKHFRLDDLSEWMAYLDTGYSMTECKEIIRKMYKNKVKDWSTQQMSFILLKKEIKKSNTHDIDVPSLELSNA
jgi:uncharacterized protein YqfB (UPF0267 family)